jgi:predicted kinase
VPLECIVLVGLPAAGKTRFYNTYFAATHRHVSKDLFPRAARPEARQRQMLADALARGESVVVDNTNPTAAGRAVIIATARLHGARVIGYFFDVSTRESIARNAERTGRLKVPNVAIFTTAKRLDKPTVAEGFDQLFYVRLTPDRTFTVSEIGEAT